MSDEENQAQSAELSSDLHVERIKSTKALAPPQEKQEIMSDAHKTLRLKVYDSDCEHFRTFTLKPQPGFLFTKLDIELAKGNFAAMLEENFPGNVFRFVKVGTANYNVFPMPLKGGFSEIQTDQCPTNLNQSETTPT